MEHSRPLQELVEDEARTVGARLPDERIKRFDPLLRLVGIDVGKLMLELVEDVMHVAHLNNVPTADCSVRATVGRRALATSFDPERRA